MRDFKPFLTSFRTKTSNAKALNYSHIKTILFFALTLDIYNLLEILKNAPIFLRKSRFWHFLTRNTVFDNSFAHPQNNHFKKKLKYFCTKVLKNVKTCAIILSQTQEVHDE